MSCMHAPGPSLIMCHLMLRALELILVLVTLCMSFTMDLFGSD